MTRDEQISPGEPVRRTQSSTTSANTRLEHRLILLVLTISFAFHAYFVFRYQGLWLDIDSSVFKLTSQQVVVTGSIVSTGPVYSNGYAAQAISAVLSEVSGIDMLTLYVFVFPLLGSLVTLPAYIMMRRLLNNVPAALLGSLFLTMHPDFIFETARSDEVKFALIFLSLCVFFLADSVGGRPHFRVSTVAAFYLVVFGLVSDNIFYASFFVVAVAVSLAVTLIRSHIGLPQTAGIGLWWKVATMAPILVFFVVYVYSPAASFILGSTSTFQKVVAFLTGQQVSLEGSFAGYSYVRQTWSPAYVFFLVSALTWIILPLSAYRFLRDAVSSLGSQKPSPTTYPHRTHPLLPLLYVGYGIVMAFSILVDSLGLYTGNTELRVLVIFLLFATPLAALVLLQLFRKPKLRNIAAVGLLICVSGFGAAVKPTNDPSLSNSWWFYTPQETSAVTWLLNNAPQGMPLFGGYGARLNALKLLVAGPENYGKVIFRPITTYSSSERPSLIFSSSVTMALAKEIGPQQTALPPSDASRVYDSGSVMIWYEPP
jgi:hypothetical protein